MFPLLAYPNRVLLIPDKDPTVEYLIMAWNSCVVKMISWFFHEDTLLGCGIMSVVYEGGGTLLPDPNRDVLIGAFSSLGTSVMMHNSKDSFEIFIEVFCSLEYSMDTIRRN